MAQPKQSAAPKLDPAARRVALIVAGALFMQNLDGAIINTSLPQIANSLAVRPVDTNIGITAYILTPNAPRLSGTLKGDLRELDEGAGAMRQRLSARRQAVFVFRRHFAKGARVAIGHEHRIIAE